MYRYVLLSAVGVISTSCATIDLQRSIASGYADYSGSQEASLNDIRAPANFQSRVLESEEINLLSSDQMIKNLEANLLTPEERAHYLRVRNNLNTKDRVGYLNLPDITTRERWLQNKGLYNPTQNFSNQVEELIRNNDIALGMSKMAVEESWGSPQSKAISGDPKFENEKWVFTVPVPSDSEYRIEKRTVIFTNGRVAGWRTTD